MSPFREATGSFIDRIKINLIVREERGGRVFWVKYRRAWSAPVVRAANAFFRAVNNPVIVWADLPAWQRWEVDSYLLLNGPEGFRAFAEGKAAVWAEQLPGRSLDDLADNGALEEPVLRAAATEMARAHALPYPFQREGLWSHGDPHMGNFIFEAATGRARLIDFEVAHRPGMAEPERQADDLLIFLQDLMGHDSRELWRERATLFLEEYHARRGEPRIAPALRRRLEHPSGLGRVWWAIRTSYLPAEERAHRIAILESILATYR